jgi:uncharacterized membrane protein
VKETTTRVEAFSDGVFAIAITLLILEVKVPHAGPEQHLWTAIAGLWPSYLAFLLSFFVIMVMWVNHHELIRMVEAVDYPFFFANGLVLLTVTIVPFPTAVLAEHLNTPEAGAAVAFYCATFVPNSLSWGLLFYTIHRGNLFKDEVTPEEISRIRGSYAVGPAVYLVATAVAFYQPWLGLAINLALWMLWVRLCYHSKTVDAEMRRRRATSRARCSAHSPPRVKSIC